MYNGIVIVGYLGSKPRLVTQGETQFATMRVATNRVWNNAKGEKVTATVWFDVIASGRTGENAANYLDRGSGVVVQGVVRPSRIWFDSDGNPRSSIPVRASRIQYLPKPHGTDAVVEGGQYDEMPPDSNDEFPPDSEIPF